MIESVEVTSLDPLPDTYAQGLALEALETEICELAGHLAAATCRFLRLIGDFDERQGWATWELRSCSAWLAWKCQVVPGTAREYVRVARALRVLPLIEAEFAAGRMSYAKARALTRIATPETEAGLADLAGPMTAAQLERFVSAHRRVSSVDHERARSMRRLAWRTEEDGQFSMSVRLPAEEGAVLLQALRAATGDVQGDKAQPDSGSDQTPGGLVDALLQLASGYLAGKIATASNPDIYQVIVHVGTDVFGAAAAVDSAEEADGADAADGAELWVMEHPADPARCHLQDGPAISPATARRIACQSMVSWMLHDRRGNVLDVGRRQRRPPPALRRAVLERDGYRCQESGAAGWLGRPSGQHDARVTAETIIPAGLGEPLNLHETIWACFANARVEAERREAATAHAA